MSTQEFRSLHQGPGVLLLPNAWDAGSARLIESLGAKAIATTSAGLAWSRGYSDDNILPDEQLVSATREIARVIRVPLTVDMEGGYSEDPRSVAELAARIIDAGAAGINIEDGRGSKEMLCAKIEAIRDRAEALRCRPLHQHTYGCLPARHRIRGCGNRGDHRQGSALSGGRW